MNAFQNIGSQGGASLATVAPGIAEALIATAVGLACAIPAVMGYNFYNHKIRGIKATPTFDAGPLQYLTQHRFGVISSQALKATRTSLTGSGVPTYTVHIPRLNAESIGALLFFYETVTAFAGELYGINAYDQPGVEETKRLLKQALVG
jgi:hypothetical protein